MGVSKNNGTPKSSILKGFSIINHPFWGKKPYFWKHSNEGLFFWGWFFRPEIPKRFSGSKESSRSWGESWKFSQVRFGTRKNCLVISRCDLFGMVKTWPASRGLLRDLQLYRGWRGHELNHLVVFCVFFPPKTDSPDVERVMFENKISRTCKMCGENKIWKAACYVDQNEGIVNVRFSPRVLFFIPLRQFSWCLLRTSLQFLAIVSTAKSAGFHAIVCNKPTQSHGFEFQVGKLCWGGSPRGFLSPPKNGFLRNLVIDLRNKRTVFLLLDNVFCWLPGTPRPTIL